MKRKSSLNMTNKEEEVINYCYNRFERHFLLNHYMRLYEDIDIPNDIIFLISNIIITITFFRTLISTCVRTRRPIGNPESLYIFNLQSIYSTLQKYPYHANMINKINLKERTHITVELVYTVKNREWSNKRRDGDGWLCVDYYKLRSDEWGTTYGPIMTEKDIYYLLTNTSINDIIALKYTNHEL